jgi:hypothetical protein
MRTPINTACIVRVSCLLATTGAIVLFWKDTVLLTALSILFAVVANSQSARKDLVVFFTVAFLATVLESVAMSSGAWEYQHKQVLNFPIWLPLYWGIGGLVLQDVYRLIDRYVDQ